jgi:hypothetical protein
VETQERNQLVLDIVRDIGVKFGLEEVVQDACGDLVRGIRISEVTMAFSEGLRESLPIPGKVVDRGAVQEMQDVPGDDREAVQ